MRVNMEFFHPCWFVGSDCLFLAVPSDLLMRDNLFEIITSSRTFYIQVRQPGPVQFAGRRVRLWQLLQTAAGHGARAARGNRGWFHFSWAYL